MTTAADGGVTQTDGTGLAVAHLDAIVSEQRLDEGLGGVFAGSSGMPAAWMRFQRASCARNSLTCSHWAFRRAGGTHSCRPSNALSVLVEQFMSVEPYSKAQRVFVIVDNGCAHRGKASIKRLEGRYENLILVYTPVHANWLNQAEIYFSIIQRNVLTPNDIPDLDTLEERLLAFGRRYEQIAAPFQWKFTRADRNRLAQRLDLPAARSA